MSKERFNDPETQIQYLIERIPYAEAAAHLQTLPAREEALFDRDALRQRIEKTKSIASKKGRALPISVASTKQNAPTRERKVATLTRGSAPKGAKLVMDYSVLVAVSNFRFRADTTYYCTNEVNLIGTPDLEGGTVIKFPPSNGVSAINIYGKLDCQTSPYCMAVLTADADTPRRCAMLTSSSFQITMSLDESTPNWSPAN